MEKLYKVAIDTNMLVYISTLKLDVFEELKKMFGNVEFCIPKSVLDELEILKDKGEIKKSHAKIAKKLIRLNNVQIIEISNNADNDLVELAKKGFYIVTNDSELKKIIKSFGGKVIYPRKRKLLEVM